MAYYLLCVAVFLSAYLLNIFYISVLYHRGLTHSAVTLRPWAIKLVASTGNWITGIDPKAWSCMHRLHHQHSDTPLDPHSPLNGGIWAVMGNQLHSYNRALRNISLKRDPHFSVVRDLEFPVHWLNRNKLWYLPYVLHAAISAIIALVFHAPLLAAGYWFGIMSHPIQGWMVNALAHSSGYRNFKTPDNSRNNTMVAWLVMGEGFQNNHHQRPQSPRFSVTWWEIDMGYGLCRLAELLGMLKVNYKMIRPMDGEISNTRTNLAH